MKRMLLAAGLALAISAAHAQEYSPPDEALWRAMQEAFAKLAMPLDAHQQVQQIMRNVEAEAARKKVAAEQKKSQP